MTEQEKQSIIDAVLSSIRTNSRSIGQLTAVSTLSEGDFFEVAGGKKVSFSVLRDLVSAFANLDAESIKTDVAKMLVQNVAFDVTESAATLTIKQQGYAAKTVSVPVATDKHSGIITAADKVKLESAYTSSQTAVTAANNAQKGVTELSNSTGKPSGIATLDGEGKLKSSQVPSNLTTETDIQNLRKSVTEEIGTAKKELDGVINKMKGVWLQVHRRGSPRHRPWHAIREYLLYLHHARRVYQLPNKYAFGAAGDCVFHAWRRRGGITALHPSKRYADH